MLNKTGCIKFKGKSLLALPLPSCWFNPVFTHNFFEIKLVLVLYFKKELIVSLIDKGAGRMRRLI